MRSKPYGDPSMGLRWPRAECYDAQGPPWLYPQKVQSRAMTLLGERPTGQKRTQRAASLILGQPPSGMAMLPAKRMAKLGLSVHRMEPPLSWYSPLRIFERSYWIPGS